MHIYTEYTPYTPLASIWSVFSIYIYICITDTPQLISFYIKVFTIVHNQKSFKQVHRKSVFNKISSIPRSVMREIVMQAGARIPEVLKKNKKRLKKTAIHCLLM